jgi:hypothetical protein
MICTPESNRLDIDNSAAGPYQPIKLLARQAGMGRVPRANRHTRRIGLSSREAFIRDQDDRSIS